MKNGNLLCQLNLNTICLHFTLLNFIYFCQNCIIQILYKLGYTHHYYSHISEANHLHEHTLNIAEKALSVSDIVFMKYYFYLKKLQTKLFKQALTFITCLLTSEKLLGVV